MTTRRALLRFVVASLLVELLLGFGGVVASRLAAHEQSINDARRITAVLARAVVKPNLTDGLLRADPESIRRLDEAIVGRVTGRTLVRVKIWSRMEGAGQFRVVYSDEHQLIGSVYTLSGLEERALLEGRMDADLSDASRPENYFERGKGKLLEVYEPVRTPNGSKLLFETYGRYSVVTARAGRIYRQFIPITLGTLLVLQVIQLPLAWSMARRLDGSLRERERLVRRVAEVSEAERRRITTDLHDGLVQDLAAISYTLVGEAEHASRSGNARQAVVLRGAGNAIRATIRSLRSLLVDVYPPKLQRVGLPAALKDLLASLERGGVAVRFAIPQEIPVSRGTAEIVFRGAQEALRNVLAHSSATAVEVAISLTDERLLLTVTDDGTGFDLRALETAPESGHVGLRTVRDLARAAGGTLDVTSSPGDGTRLRLEVPRR